MQELSMNILDVAENSVSAGAALVQITLTQNTAAALQTLTIEDDGKGMDADMVRRVTDPFVTTRTTRKVGLGLPFLKMAAELTGGGLHITSTPGVGTAVTATFGLNHIDLAPLGDVGGTIATLCQGAPDSDFVFTFTRDNHRFCFDTREARAVLGGVPLNTPEVTLFIRDHVREGVDEAMHNS